MNVYVLCGTDENDSLLKVVKEYFKCEEAEFINSYTCVDNENSAIVLSHSIIPNVKGYDLTGFNNVYVYFNGKIVSVKEEEGLISLRKKAIDEGNWNRAKWINDLLIDINFINRNETLSSLPDYLQIETTSFCNAKCIMCSHYFSRNKGAAHLGGSTLENMRDAIQLSHTISLNGMGEPFVSPYLSDQIDFYAGFGNRIVTNTNLSVITPRLIDQINRQFDWLEISCDGATKETYESIRKNLNFEEFLKNLFLLKEMCPKVRKHIATVIMRQNVHEMPQIVELAARSGASIVTFMTLNSNIIIRNQQDEMHHYPKVLEYYSAKALEMGQKCGIPVIVPNMDRIDTDISFEEITDELDQMKQLPMFKDTRETEQMERTASVVTSYLETHDEIQRDTCASKVKCTGICDWLLKRSYIDLQGNVAMCCRNQSFHTGNVNETRNFAEVWNSEFYRKLRRIFYSGSVPESCLKCGMVESGNLEFLHVDINEEFYKDPGYKLRQKETLQKLLEECVQ